MTDDELRKLKHKELEEAERLNRIIKERVIQLLWLRGVPAYEALDEEWELCRKGGE